MSIRFPIQFHLFDVQILLTVQRSFNRYILSIFQMNSRFLEQRSTYHIFIASRTYRIESQCSKYIPCRSLSIVLVTTISIRSRCVHLIHHLTQPVLRFPRLFGIIVQINHVLDRLVSMCIVTHIHHGHFTNLMNYKTIIAVIKYRRYREDRIKHRHKGLVPSHQVNQSLRVMEYRPGVVPAVSFSEGIPPFQRRERLHEFTVFLFASHQFGLRIKQILIVHSTFCKKLDFLFRALQFFSKFIDTPVIIRIFQCTGCVLVYLHTTRHVT